MRKPYSYFENNWIVFGSTRIIGRYKLTFVVFDKIQR